jgi:phosphoribosylformylglycinamidine synthase subunit PurS
VKAIVTVYPRREVLDPQGKAIAQALQRVGFDEVREVRAGKSFEIELGVEDRERARERLARMCETLLANTVVEYYSIEIEGGSIELERDSIEMKRDSIGIERGSTGVERGARP